MTSDFTVPDIEPNSALSHAESISHLSDIEVNSTVPNMEPNLTITDGDSNPIIPDAELNSVLLYLKSNSDSIDIELDSAIPNVELNHSASSDVELDSGFWDMNFTESTIVGNKVKNNTQVQLKSEGGRLLV